VEGVLLLADGFHVRVPDGDCGVREAGEGVCRPGRAGDSEFVHLAWRNNHEDLRDLPIPMLADKKQELGKALDILHKGIGMYLRATYIVDPEGIIRFVSVNDLSVGRNPGEVLRVLDALQTDELCPCNWEKGQATL
jgi:lipoyl-dependent peroxiredoxin subunit C